MVVTEERKSAKSSLVNKGGVFVAPQNDEDTARVAKVKEEPKVKVPTQQAEASQTLPKGINELLDTSQIGFGKKLDTNIKENEPVTQNGGTLSINQEIDEVERMRGMALAGENASRIMITQEASRKERIKNIVEGLRIRKIFINEDEAEDLINSNFQVKFPWIMLSVTGTKYLGEITIFLGGIAIFVTGLGATGLAAVVPVVGVLLGAITAFISAPMYLSGLAISTLTTIEQIIYQFFMFIWGFYYAQNSTDLTKHIKSFRQTLFKIFMKRTWLLLLGWIPLVGGAIDIILILYTYNYVKKKVEEVKQVVREN